MEYLLEAKARTEFLWIGITQYVISALQDTAADLRRSLRQNNPFTYHERAVILREALNDAGVSSAEFAIAPFPMEKPDLLREFLAINIPILTTVYDDWNRHKVRVLRALGYQVIVLWERDWKRCSGQDVRNLIAAGDKEWRNLVPRATARAVVEYELKERLLALR